MSEGGPQPILRGTKFDDNKLPYHLLAPESLEGLIKVIQFGAKKYAERNWEKGLVYSRVFSATMRHLWAWWRGEENDPETGYSHLDHAQACVHFLSTYVKRGLTNLDDRPRVSPKILGRSNCSAYLNSGVHALHCPIGNF